jgi:hypothetical protein
LRGQTCVRCSVIILGSVGGQGRSLRFVHGSLDETDKTKQSGSCGELWRGQVQLMSHVQYYVIVMGPKIISPTQPSPCVYNFTVVSHRKMDLS